MADYNIYIHSNSSAEMGDKTKPFTSQYTPTKPFDSADVYTEEEQASLANIKSMALKTYSAFKTLTPVAGAIATFKVVQKYQDLRLTQRTMASGDYSMERTYNNVKQTFSNIFSPFSLFINQQTEQAQSKYNQLRVNQNIALLGDSIIINGKRDI